MLSCLMTIRLMRNIPSSTSLDSVRLCVTHDIRCVYLPNISFRTHSYVHSYFLVRFMSAGQSSTEMVVAVVSKDPNVWVQVGRIIGITLAIVETGKLLASFLVSYEVKASTSHFRRTREEAYARVEQLRLTRTESQLAKGLLDPSKRIFPSQSTSIIPSEGDWSLQ